MGDFGVAIAGRQKTNVQNCEVVLKIGSACYGVAGTEILLCGG